VSGFGVPIIDAIIAFPIILIALFIPFLFLQYRRYGAVTFWHTVMTFSFVFYFTTAFFLVILPLPTEATLEHLQAIGAPTRNLDPLQVVRTFFQDNPYFHGGGLKAGLLDPSFTQAAFNVLLTVPFGMYLHFYFKRGFFTTLILTFMLTLFYETTQYTGLYHIYWRPYRLFDVDDLILNTTGGLIGWVFAPLLGILLPSRDRMDERARSLGHRVTLVRRLLSFGLDFVIATAISFVLTQILPNETSADVLSYIIVWGVVPLLLGATLGQMVVRIRYDVAKSQRWRIIVRNALMVGFTIYFFPFWLQLIGSTGTVSAETLNRTYTFILLFAAPAVILVIDWLITIFRPQHKLLYEKISGAGSEAIVKTTTMADAPILKEQTTPQPEVDQQPTSRSERHH